MKKIYSKIDPTKLLHILYTKHDMVKGDKARDNLSADNDLVQIASMCLKTDQTFPSHIHLEQVRHTVGTQESWIVIDGVVNVYYYDIDGTFLQQHELLAGDCTITFHGGHTYKAMTDALVYEFKNGPYNGYEKDKRLI